MAISLVSLPAPQFDLVSTKDLDTLDQKVTLRDYRDRWLILFFYPMDYSFVCPTEIRAFSERYEEFRSLDCDIVGVSTDNVYTHRAWIRTSPSENGLGILHYPLVSDLNHQVSRAYGVLNEETGMAERGLFIIDPEGIVRYQVVTAENVGRDVDETLRVLHALQTGGLCPANWKPDQTKTHARI